MDTLALNTTKKKNWNKYLFPLILIFKASCDLCYVFSLMPIFNYYSVFYLEFNISKYLLSWVFTILLSLRFTKGFCKSDIKISSIIVFGLFLLSYVPIMTLFGMENNDYQYAFLVNIYWAFILILEYLFCACKKTKRETKISSHKGLIAILGIAVVILVVAFSYRYTGLSFNLDLNDAYILRHGEIRSLSGPLQYVFVWLGVLVPFFTVYAFNKKRYFLFCGWLAVLFLLYSIEGNRTTFFIVPVAIIASIIMNSKRLWMIPFAFIGINLVAIIEAQFTQSIYISGYWSMRTLFTPAGLSNIYYDFFSTNPPDYLAQSIFRRFGAVSRYEMSIPYMLDVLYMGGDGTGSVNTGMFGDAFANFGIHCVWIYPIIMLIVFKLINYFMKNISIKHAMLFIIYYIIALCNASPFTTLLTNGLLVIGLIYRLIGNDLFDKRRRKTESLTSNNNQSMKISSIGLKQ